MGKNIISDGTKGQKEKNVEQSNQDKTIEIQGCIHHLNTNGCITAMEYLDGFIIYSCSTKNVTFLSLDLCMIFVRILLLFYTKEFQHSSCRNNSE
jgi:hypothetical protein